MEEAQRVFHELSDGGTVQMPLQKTFWAEIFGSFVDRYGTPWMINVNSTDATHRADAEQESGRP